MKEQKKNQRREDPGSTPPSNSARSADGRVASRLHAGQSAKTLQNGDNPQSASLRGRPRAAEIVVTNDGQRRLLERTEGVVELARLVGVSTQQVTKWRAGERKPRPESARRLLATLSIPVDAWTQPHVTEAAPSPPAPQGEPRRTYSPTSLAEIEEMLEALRVHVPGLTERELAKRFSERRSLLALKLRSEHQERLAEVAIVRSHPQWAAIRKAMTTALTPYPEALEALVKHLSPLLAWENAKAELAATEGEEP